MIELKQVSKSFGERELFSNLSMTFEVGKVYALIGSSGSGKTTLMNMMGKLEPYDGTIFYRDEDLASCKSSDFFHHELGYLFQNFGLIENQTIEENLKLGLIGQIMLRRRLERIILVFITINILFYKGEIQVSDLKRIRNSFTIFYLSQKFLNKRIVIFIF